MHADAASTDLSAPVRDHPTTLAARAIDGATPHERLEAIAALRAELDPLEYESVRAAITAGSSWAQVAEALGISKQSAHRRFAKRVAASGPRRVPQPRRSADESRPADVIVVTARARRAVRAARAAARTMRHVEVDPGHVLLGVMADETGPAATALGAIGVEFDAAREAVARLGLPATPAGSPEKRRIPISPAAREALEQSLHEARRLGHTHLGAEHLLLALLRDEDSGAARALSDIGIPPDDIERCLGKILKEAPFSRQ